MSDTRMIPDRDAAAVGAFLSHLDGVPWYEAPIPRRWHRCSAQTVGIVSGEFVDRCACGAISLGLGRHWMERNSRRTTR